MIVWLIYDRKDVERNKRSIELYFQACKKRNVRLEFFTEDEFTIEMKTEEVRYYQNGSLLPKADAVINRTRNYFLAVQLEMAGLRVYNNARVTLLGARKDLALAHVRRLGCEVMDTKSGNLSGIWEEKDFPVVIKSVDGHGGTEVFMAHNQEEYHARTQCRGWISQQTASEKGKDVRVYVLGGNIIAAMLRKSQEDFRSNFCLGGAAEVYTLSAEETVIVRRIIQSLDMDFCGIDFIFHQGRFIFNEIEDVVGARMLYTLTDLDVIDMYVEYICRKDIYITSDS